MRKEWKQSLLVSVACAVLAVGCGGNDRGTDYRTAGDAADSTETISLNGCIGVAPGSANEFALQQVRVVPPDDRPSSAPQQTAAHAITEGSWVRLAMADDAQQLRQRVGERVTITGAIRDDGRDLVGTSGPRPAPQQRDPRQPESRAGAEEHHSEKVEQEVGLIGQQSMATGTAPLVRVQRIDATGEPCNPEVRQPDDRR